MNQYQQGYEDALADVLDALILGGTRAAAEWIHEKRARLSRQIAAQCVIERTEPESSGGGK